MKKRAWKMRCVDCDFGFFLFPPYNIDFSQVVPHVKDGQTRYGVGEPEGNPICKGTEFRHIEREDEWRSAT